MGGLIWGASYGGLDIKGGLKLGASYGGPDMRGFIWWA